MVQQHKSIYHVDTGAEVIEAVLRGTLKGRREKPCVGDLVTLRIPRDPNSPAIITGIEPRRNLLFRPVIANVDQALFVASVRRPQVERDMIDRFLTMAEHMKIAACLVFNKVDLLNDAERDELSRTMGVYTNAGYPCVILSTLTGEGLDSVRDLCRGKVSTLAGPSGAGKSSLLNALVPGLNLDVSPVSTRTETGVHTTTTTTLLKLAPDTFIADTPGFAVIALPPVHRRDLRLLFPEFRRVAGGCRFNDCLHREEPECAVREGVRRGEIDAGRYASYCRFLDELLRTTAFKP